MEPAHVPAAIEENQLMACLLNLATASPEEQLNQVNLLRQGVVNGLIKDAAILKDPQLLTVLKGLAKDIDGSNLGRIRLMQEKDNSDENTKIQKAYIALMQRFGGKLPQPGIPSPDRNLSPEFDITSFSVIEGETKIGNDILDTE
jgi:hypothetical protein